jgi:hypothetical protein
VSAPGASESQKRGSGEVRLIARRELRERLRAKSFAISTGALIVIILAMGIVSRVVGGDEPEATVVGVAGEAPEGFDQALGQVAEAIDRDVEVVRVDVDVADEAGIRKVLEDGDADVVIEPSERSVVHDGDVDDELQAVVQQAWAATETRQALVDDEGIDADRVDELLSPEPLAATALEEDWSSAVGPAAVRGLATAAVAGGLVGSSRDRAGGGEVGAARGRSLRAGAAGSERVDAAGTGGAGGLAAARGVGGATGVATSVAARQLEAANAYNTDKRPARASVVSAAATCSSVRRESRSSSSSGLSSATNPNADNTDSASGRSCTAWPVRNCNSARRRCSS